MFRLAYCLTAAMFVCGCVGCSMFEVEPDCPNCAAGSPEMAEQGRFLEQTMIEELGAAKEQNAELKMRVTDLSSTNSALNSQIAQLRSERETHQYSVQQANQQVDSTQTELQNAATSIQQLRQDLQQLVDEVAAIDSAHTAEIVQFSRRLERMLSQRANAPVVPQTPPAIQQQGGWAVPKAGQ